MDRGFIDFARLARLDQTGAFFVTRAKTNMRFRRRSSVIVDKATGLRCDQTISLIGHYTRQDYPQRLRRIRFREPETGKQLVSLTNHFGLSALTICHLYRLRWQNLPRT